MDEPDAMSQSAPQSASRSSAHGQAPVAQSLDLTARDPILVLAIATIGGVALGSAVWTFAVGASLPTDLATAAVGWTQSLLFVLAVWFVTLRPRRVSWREFGIRRIDGGAAGFALALAVGAIALGYAVESVVFVLTDIDPSLEQAHAIGLDRAGPAALTLFCVGAVFLAPIGEEAMFRGVLLPWMRRHVGQWPAIVASSAVFAALHLQFSALPSLFIVGLALGWCAVRTASLTGPILCHMVYNGIAMSAHLANF